MFSIKSLAIAAAVSAGVVFAMPVASQATTSTVKIYTGTNNKHKSTNWWARHCAISNDVKCGRHYTRSYHHRQSGPYYGYYRPHHHHKSSVIITY